MSDDEDFLICAIAMVDKKLNREDFLVEVLKKIRRDLQEEHEIISTDDLNFHSRTLAELTRRINLQKDLKTDISRVTKERNDFQVQLERCAGSRETPPNHHQVEHALQTERALRAEIDQIKKYHAVDLEHQADALQKATKERDAALRQIGEQMEKHQKLQAVNTQLGVENAKKEKALRELQDNDQKCLDIATKLQARNDRLEQKIESLDLEATRSWTNSHGHEKTTSSEREPADVSDDESEAESVHEGKTAGEPGSQREVVQTPCGKGLPNLPASILPNARRQLVNEADFEGILPAPQDVVIFNRQFLSVHLGGAKIALQVKISQQKLLAKKFNISSFMCPNLDHNPWAPSAPGVSGIMFVGLGNEKDAFSEPETHEVFVQYAPKQMFYAGRYVCRKVEDLQCVEWDMLDIEVKKKYSETTRKKSGTKDTADVVLKRYNDGTLLAPCVLLECIGFNWELYDALATAAKCTHTTHFGSPSGAKRKRTNQDAESNTPNTPEARQKKGRYAQVGTPDGGLRVDSLEDNMDDIFV